jgi:hypothetical protein
VLLCGRQAAGQQHRRQLLFVVVGPAWLEGGQMVHGCQPIPYLDGLSPASGWGQKKIDLSNTTPLWLSSKSQRGATHKTPKFHSPP